MQATLNSLLKFKYLKWKQIISVFPNRTTLQCKAFYRKLMIGEI